LPERRFRLIRGYKRAGDVLIKQVLSERSDRDNLVFPVLFNYRHYIELALKAIIEEHGPFAGVAPRSNNHRLPVLWDAFLQVAIKFQNDPTDAAAVAVGQCIGELAAIDANSTTFRYAKTIWGDVPALPERLDLLQLYDAMNGIENFLECADLDFSYKTDCAMQQAFEFGE